MPLAFSIRSYRPPIRLFALIEGSMVQGSQDFAGRHVVITGGAGGIGLATARHFLARGAAVSLLDLSADDLEAARATLGDDGRVATARCDVASEASVRAAFGSLGRAVDVLVNGAGITGFVGPLDATPLDGFDRVFAINVRGTFLACGAVLAGMKSRRSGAIINLASTAALVGSVRLGAYAATKAAIVSMTRSLAISVAPLGVRVNAVCPGAIETAMFDELTADDPSGETRARLAALHPLGRVGTADEVAAAIVFLASPAASFITGTALPIDGGRTA